MMQQPPAPQPAMMQQPPAPVQEQPVMQPAPAQSAMIDTAGPDEAPAAMPEMPQPSHYRSKADWLNWKPHDDTAQVAGMLKQLGALKAQKGQVSALQADSDAPRENVAAPASLANDLNKLDDDDDSSNQPSSESSGSSWGSLVPPQLAARVQQQQPHVNRFLDTTPPAAPAQPAPMPVAAPQPEPQAPPPQTMEAPQPQAPQQNGFLQQAAQQPSAPAQPAP